MRAEKPAPTILDKWRRKAFQLAQELVEMEQEHASQVSKFRAAESVLSQRILDAKTETAQINKENIKLENERKYVESQIATLERYSTAIDSQTERASEHYKQIIEAGIKHMHPELPQVPKLESEMEKISEQITKLKSLVIPKAPSKWTQLEVEVKELNSILREKTSKCEDQKAAISIYRKLSAAQRKYHQLEVQMKGIEAEIEKENQERKKEQDLRERLVNLKDQLKRKVNEKESELREIYEARKLERDKLIRQKKNLQIEMENTKSKTEAMEHEVKSKIHEYEETVQKQKEEIQELSEKVATMEAMLRFDKETNTETKDFCPPEFQIPKKPPAPVSTEPLSAIPLKGSSMIAKLDALFVAATEVMKDHTD